MKRTNQHSTEFDFSGYVSSDEFYLIVSFEIHKDSEYIFESNFHELLMIFDNYATQSEDFKRRLHNYLVSFSTLIDHTRKFLKLLPKPFASIETKKKDLQNNILNCFVKRLRNYVTHNMLPTTSREIQMLDGKLLLGALSFHCDALLKWDGWDKPSKSFLQSSDRIDIKSILIEHFNLIVAFHEYIDINFRSEYEKEFAKYRSFCKKFAP